MIDLKNKTKCKTSITKYVSEKGWVSECRRTGIPVKSNRISPGVLKAFKMYYPNGADKHAMVMGAEQGHMTWYLDRTRNTGCFRINGIDVSYKFNPPTKHGIVTQALRGAIAPTSLMQKVGVDTEMDHINDGGFASIKSTFITEVGLDILHENVKYNDNVTELADWVPFCTLREPYLSQWILYHDSHAEVEEISKSEHTRRTAHRRRS